MIVEDEPLERFCLRKIIQKRYFNINILEDAINGPDAVEKAKIYRPDIILMDVRLPELTGLEAQKSIIRFLPNVKTIILTAYNEFDYAQEAIKYGVVEYLLKPVKPTDLQVSIDLAIESLTKDNVQNKNIVIDDNILKNVLNYIDNNYCSELTINTVAELVHFNPQYFSRYFKKEMGITFTEYVTTLRIEKAKKLLVETNYPIYRIAAELGFADPAYFNRVFLKYAKQSPNKYKQTIKQGS
jgi:YesN/AraC family two-component response regulator